MNAQSSTDPSPLPAKIVLSLELTETESLLMKPHKPIPTDEATTFPALRGKKATSFLDPLRGEVALIFGYPRWTRTQDFLRKIAIPTIVPYGVFAQRYCTHFGIGHTESFLSSRYGYLRSLPIAKIYKLAHKSAIHALRHPSAETLDPNTLKESVLSFVSEQISAHILSIAHREVRAARLEQVKNERRRRPKKSGQPSQASSSLLQEESFYGPQLEVFSTDTKQPPRKKHRPSDYAESQGDQKGVMAVLSAWIDSLREKLTATAVTMVTGIVSMISQLASIWMHESLLGQGIAAFGLLTSLVSYFPTLVQPVIDCVINCLWSVREAWRSLTYIKPRPLEETHPHHEMQEHPLSPEDFVPPAFTQAAYDEESFSPEDLVPMRNETEPSFLTALDYDLAPPSDDGVVDYLDYPPGLDIQASTSEGVISNNVVTSQGFDMKSLKDSVSKWLNAIWTMLSRVFSVDLDASCVRLQGVTNFNTLVTAMKNGFWIAGPILSALEKFINHCATAIIGRPVLRRHQVETAHAFEVFEKQEARLHADLTADRTSSNARAYAAYVSANLALPRLFLRMPEEARRAFNPYWSKVEQRLHKARAAAPPDDIRVEPVAVYIYGPPAVHKTTIRSILVKYLADQLFMECSTYSKNSTDLYWEGYAGQFAVFLEEFLQQSDCVSRTTIAREFMELRSTGPYSLNMAFEGKGTTYFTSPFIIATTNADIAQVDLRLAEPAAFRRRFDFVIEVELPSQASLMTDQGRVANLKSIDGIPNVELLRFKLHSTRNDVPPRVLTLGDLCNLVRDAHLKKVAHKRANTDLDIDTVMKILQFSPPREAMSQGDLGTDVTLLRLMSILDAHPFDPATHPPAPRTVVPVTLAELTHPHMTEDYLVKGRDLGMMFSFPEDAFTQAYGEVLFKALNKFYGTWAYAQPYIGSDPLSVYEPPKQTTRTWFEWLGKGFDDMLDWTNYTVSKHIFYGLYNIGYAAQKCAKYGLLAIGLSVATVLVSLGGAVALGTYAYKWWKQRGTTVESQGVSYDIPRVKIPQRKLKKAQVVHHKPSSKVPAVAFAQGPSSNIYKLSTEHQGYLAVDSYVMKYHSPGGRDIIVNLHSLAVSSAESEFTLFDISGKQLWNGAFKDLVMRRAEEADFVCIRFPKTIQQWKEISHLYVKESDLDFVCGPYHRVSYDENLDFPVERIYACDLTFNSLSYEDELLGKMSVYGAHIPVAGIKGDCMETYWTSSTQVGARQILGHHVAGNGDSSYISILSQELLKELRDFPGSQGYEKLVPPTATILKTGVRPAAFPNGESNLVPSPYQRNGESLLGSKTGRQLPILDAPAILKTTDGLSPIAIATAKIEPPDCSGTNEKLLEEISTYLLKDVSIEKGKVPHELDVKTAILGLGNHFGAMNRKTSPGWPWNTMVPQKHIDAGFPKKVGSKVGDWIEFIYDAEQRVIDVYVDPKLLEAITNLRSQLSSKGKVDIDACFTVFPKDETRPKEKVNNKQTRLVNGSPLHLTVVSRMLVGFLLKEIHRNRCVKSTNSESAVGLSVESYDVTRFANNLLLAGRFFDFDFSKFDTKQLWQIAKYIARAVCHWYKDKSLRLPITNLLRFMWNAKYILGDVIYQLFFQLASGWVGTADFNGLYNRLCTTYAILRIQRENGRPRWTVPDALSKCWLVVYGDDSVLRVPNHDCFTYDRFIEAYAELGLIATSGSKTSIDAEFLGGHDVVFLKRHVIYLNGAPYLARDKVAIRGGLNWCFKASNFKTFHIGIARSMLRDMVPHGKEEYDNLVTDLQLLDNDLVPAEMLDFAHVLCELENTDFSFYYGK